KKAGYEETRSKDGVGCAVCHGTFKPWVTEHANITGDNDWRSRSGDEKQKRGMIDLRNPLTRAELCMSCHIGNAQLGRVVTHDISAAGHPPLPSIEIATFTGDNMPRHWKLMRKLPFFQQNEGNVKLMAGYHYGKGVLEETRTAAVSGV